MKKNGEKVKNKVTAHFGLRLRDLLLMLIDMMTVFIVFNVAFYFCRIYLKQNPALYYESLCVILPVYLIVFIIFGTYRSLWRYAHSKEYMLCNIASFVAGAIYFGICRIIFVGIIPLHFYLLVICANAICFVSIRLFYRALREYLLEMRNQNSDDKRKRCLIVGCGNACYTMLSEIHITDNCALHPVVAVDDDISKVGKSIYGLSIEGTIDDIPALCRKYNINQIIIAIPSAENKERSRILDKCSEVECEVRILPRLHDFENTERGFLQKLREITPDELLGREVVNCVNDEMLSFISHKTVMITGGGGSIGSELCRQVAANSPDHLIIVDIYENSAYDIEQELRYKYGKALKLTVLIASVRDFRRISNIMREYRPNFVIHAAAHKHVPLMEMSPAEAVKNNIFGTLNTAKAAKKNGVEKFIMISTDKAVNPTNIMGATKRACEIIVQAMNEEADGTTRFSAVRFGNVLGSNGSVIPLFKNQIASGGPVTVTHPDIIRYFMTIPEAVQLVLAASLMANGGEVFVLDMGEPVKILDLARKMIQLAGFAAGRDIKIEFTGLRPGEKLFEELLMDEEGLEKTANNKIYIGHYSTIDKIWLRKTLDDLWDIASDDTRNEEVTMELIEKKLMELVPTFVRVEYEDITDEANEKESERNAEKQPVLKEKVPVV